MKCSWLCSSSHQHFMLPEAWSFPTSPCREEASAPQQCAPRVHHGLPAPSEETSFVPTGNSRAPGSAGVPQCPHLASRPTAQWWLSAWSSISQIFLFPNSSTSISYPTRQSSAFRVSSANLQAEHSPGHTRIPGPGSRTMGRMGGGGQSTCWGWWQCPPPAGIP